MSLLMSLLMHVLELEHFIRLSEFFSTCKSELSALTHRTGRVKPTAVQADAIQAPLPWPAKAH